MRDVIIEKYIKQLSKKTHDSIYLEAVAEEIDAENQKNIAEIERLKKILDENGISYEDKEVEDEPNQE